MKLKPLTQLAAALALGLACIVPSIRAASFTDNFGTTHDYLHKGVVGTPWTGVSLGSVTPGTVTDWDANTVSNSSLTITNKGGSWQGNQDGPYLWTMEKGSGDFTNIVHISNLQQINYNFAGLLVRDPNTAAQNWLYLSVFAEFGFANDVRDTTNGNSTETTFSPSGYVETNAATWTSWLEITRVGGVLTTYGSVDGTNYQLVYQSPRTDLTNDLQVGVWDSTFSGNTCSAQFQNFSLVDASATNPIAAPPASGLVVTPAVNSLGLSWTPGAGSAGSLVLIRQSTGITRQPLNGTNYVGDPTLVTSSNLGEGNLVAYVGTGNSVTITNLTPSINYTVAVYSFTNSGPSIVYSYANTPFATASPSGTPTGITLAFQSTLTNQVAVDDTAQASVTLHFSGGATVDVTSSSTFSSANSNIASISATGLASGLSNGTVAITANYTNFAVTSNLVVVKLPVTDDFSTPKNYLTGGIAGTYWSGLLLDTNDLPSGGGDEGPTQTFIANAGISHPNRLTVSTKDGGYGPGDDTGFFLYRLITGNFTISIQVPQFDSAPSNYYHMPGLMVRLPYTFQNFENFIDLVRFDNFSTGTISESVTNMVYNELDLPGQSKPFMMIQRTNDTFILSTKNHALDPWTVVRTVNAPEWTGQAIQVGIVDQTFTDDTASSQFANLTLTADAGIGTSPNAPASPTGLVLSNLSGGQISANWTAGVGSTGSVLIGHALTGVTYQPADGQDFTSFAFNDFGFGDSYSGSNMVLYASTGHTVTVSDVPATLLYFSVYSYATVNGTNFYNQVPATASINLAPPAVTMGITNVPGGFQLSWSQGTLLTATNVLGPWVTNTSAVSPFTVTNNSIGNMFFRIKVQ